MNENFSLIGYDRPTSERKHFPLGAFILENVSLFHFLPSIHV